MCDLLDISLSSISISLPSILFGTRQPCVPGKMAVFYHTEQVLNDLSPHTMSLKLQINLFPRIIIDNLPLVFASCLLTYFWIGNETVLLALRLQMNSFPSLPESRPLVTLSENDPNWILPWAGREQGMRGEKMPSDWLEKGKTPWIISPLSHVQLLVHSCEYTLGLWGKKQKDDQLFYGFRTWFFLS